MQGLLIWLYAGLLAGVLARASEEPAYATIFVFPLLLAVGEQPQVVTLSFTISTAVAGTLNLIYQKVAAGGAVIHFEFLKSLPVLAGIAAGAVVWLFATWDILKVLVATAMVATGARLLLYSHAVKVSGGARHFLNFAVGFADALMGTAVAFALVRALVAEVEALLPLLRVVEAAAAAAVKQKIILGGFLAGLGVFIGQNIVNCERSRRLRAAYSLAMIGTGLYLLLTP